MAGSTLLLSLGGGVLAELIAFFVLTRLLRLNGRAAAASIALLAILFYVPWGVLTWPGADVFAIHLAVYLTVAYALGLVGSRVGKGWHWAPAVIVGFFVIVVVINVVFLSVADRGITGIFSRLLPEPRVGEVADSRFPGTVSHDYQEKEALYNAYLRQVDAQRARGWQVRKGWQYQPVAGQPATFIVAVTDRAGGPVSSANVEGRFLRTSNSRDDFEFAMYEVAPGEYRASMTMALPGRWQLVLQIRRDEDLHEVRAETTVAGVDDADS